MKKVYKENQLAELNNLTIEAFENSIVRCWIT